MRFDLQYIFYQFECDIEKANVEESQKENTRQRLSKLCSTFFFCLTELGLWLAIKVFCCTFGFLNCCVRCTKQQVCHYTRRQILYHRKKARCLYGINWISPGRGLLQNSAWMFSNFSLVICLQVCFRLVQEISYWKFLDYIYARSWLLLIFPTFYIP